MQAVATGLNAGKKGPGYLVETSQGKGRTFHSDDLVEGKLPVYLETGKKILCSLDKVKQIGFVD